MIKSEYGEHVVPNQPRDKVHRSELTTSSVVELVTVRGSVSLSRDFPKYIVNLQVYTVFSEGKC